jgi:hypothetical protein
MEILSHITLTAPKPFFAATNSHLAKLLMKKGEMLAFVHVEE